ncbi:MAG: MFS transporter [Bradyrhizobiaceae bacterium]|nr:MFS transporter [Bradyrhizobiaceae bacterium]
MLRPPTEAAPALATLDQSAVRKIIIGVLLAMLLAALDQTIVATALPTMSNSLGDVDNLSWVVTAYLLSATATTPLYGKLSDIHGRRTMILIGIGVFIAGSIACAVAPTMWALIIGRALQGLGGGGLVPLAQAVIGDVAPPHERARYQALTGTVFLVATVGGPIVGGFITQYLHWSLIFWINVPLGAMAFAMTHDLLRRLPRHDRPHALDVLGAVLMVGAATILMLALTWGGHRYPWGSPVIVALFVCSLGLWVLFALRQVTAREPFIPVGVMYDGVVRSATAAAFFANGTTVALTIFVALYFQLALGVSASRSGIAIIALQGGATLAAMMTGRLMARVAHYRRIPMFSLGVGIASLSLLALEPTNLPLTLVVVLIVLVGCGIGPMFPTTIVAIQNAVSLHQLGIASSLISFSRSLGGSLIVTAFSAIVLVGAPDGGPTAVEHLAGQAGSLSVSVFRWVFVAGATCLSAAFGCLMLIEERPLRGSFSGSVE